MKYGLVIILSILLTACSGGSTNNSGSDDGSIDDHGFNILNIGRAPFAITAPSFACDDFLNSVQNFPELHIAFLFNTFGNDFTCLNRVIQDPRTKTIMIHLVNEPGHRNKRLGEYEFLYKVKSPSDYDYQLRTQNPTLKWRFDNYVQPVVELVKTFPEHIQCIISPGLESNLSNDASKILINWTRNHFPNCKIAWNPLRNSKISVSMVDADLVESHGKNPQLDAPCTVNTDGTDISFPDRPSFQNSEWYIKSGPELTSYVKKYASKCDVVFLWVTEDNCLRPGNFIDPRDRRCSVATESGINGILFRELEIISQTEELDPTVSTEPSEPITNPKCTEVMNARDGNEGFLLKNGESTGKVVILLPERFVNKFDAVTIERLDGSRETLSYSGFANGNRHHYRGSRPTSSYKGNSRVIATEPNNRCEWQLPNMSSRID